MDFSESRKENRLFLIDRVPPRYGKKRKLYRPSLSASPNVRFDIMHFDTVKLTPDPDHFPFLPMQAGGRRVGVEVAVAVGVGVFVTVGEGVNVGVAVGVAVGVDVGVLVGVLVGVIVGVRVGVEVGVSVGPRSWPGPQAESNKIAVEEQSRVRICCLVFMALLHRMRFKSQLPFTESSWLPKSPGRFLCNQSGSNHHLYS